MYSSRLLVRLSTLHVLLIVLTLFVLLWAKPIPFSLFIWLVVGTIALGGYASVVIKRLRNTAEANPNLRVGPRGFLRFALYAGEALGLLLFLFLFVRISQSNCPHANWACSVQVYEHEGAYLRQVNGGVPVRITAQEFDSSLATVESAMAGMLLMFSLMALWTGIAGTGYEAYMNDNQRLERP